LKRGGAETQRSLRGREEAQGEAIGDVAFRHSTRCLRDSVVNPLHQYGILLRVCISLSLLQRGFAEQFNYLGLPVVENLLK